ncbi:hypothetical protein [Boseongicola sp. H5]|uniref:hypothetical protein n=1 Tax=Boseongicola sp. H5 TaxID=2763261 RepID=UPI001D0A24C5|nr:hypothetical protein [Boseongicola sp. H5]
MSNNFPLFSRLYKWLRTEEGKRRFEILIAFAALIISLFVGFASLALGYRTLALQHEIEFRNSSAFLSRGVIRDTPVSIYIENVGPTPIRIDDIVIKIANPEPTGDEVTRLSLLAANSPELLIDFWPISDLQESYSEVARSLLPPGTEITYQYRFHGMRHAEWLGVGRQLELFRFSALVNNPFQDQTLEISYLHNANVSQIISDFSTRLLICINYTTIWGHSNSEQTC